MSQPRTENTPSSGEKSANISFLGDVAPHTLPAEDILSKLSVDPKWGLDEDQAKELLAKHGPNRLKPPKKISPWRLFMAQVLNAMTLVLIAAMAVSFGIMDWIAGGVIAGLIIMNVTVGFTQELKAEKTLAALESVGSPTATVVRHNPSEKGSSREGRTFTIPTEDVVIGDIIALKIGDVVPADARLIPGFFSNLESDEALLTGESLPSAKTTDALSDPKCPVGDRTNMVYSGSEVTKGRARAIVTMTGMDSELGKIASALDRKKESQKTGLARLWEKVKAHLGLAETTPLQIKLNTVAYCVLGMAVVLAIIVVSSTGYRNIPESIATYAVAAAVSILPESLPAVISLTLAVACRDLAARNALVRRMDAVETIGGVTDICSDKTGTITVGRMMLKKAWTPSLRSKRDPGQTYSVESAQDPFYPRGTIRMEPTEAVSRDNEGTDGQDFPRSSGDNASDDEVDELDSEDIVQPSDVHGQFEDLVSCAALNNMATLSKRDENKGWEANGDPTEIALQVFAHKAGRGKPHLTHKRKAPRKLERRESRHSDHTHVAHIAGHYEMLVEHPFDSTIKRMSTAWEFVAEDAQDNEPKPISVFLKGAVERVLERCTHIGMGDERIELTQEGRDNIIARMDALAGEGLRVLGLSGKRVSGEERDNITNAKRDSLEVDCGFLGLVGIYDPPREESAGAVADALRAGIAVRMLTGDHAATATSIARSVGILTNDHGPTAVMTGPQFDDLKDSELDALPELPVVVARCSPETKVRMIEALHRRGRKAVMTGDGVNDSPSLKSADVGVAMGLNGSDVAKGVADIVLANDKFDTIVRAIRKGRSVFNNLSKFLIYLLSGNVAEVLFLMVGLAFRKDGVAVYPISPVAALWVNTISAGPPALALGIEGTDKNAMSTSPDEYQQIFTPSWFLDTLFYGFLIGAQVIANYVIVLYGYADGSEDVEVWCNDSHGGLQEGCHDVFRARATGFSTILILLMVHAFQCKHRTRSIFHMKLGDNRLLLWSVITLSLTVFPIVYIPTINDHVFMVTSISWEWGIVFGQIVLYMVIVELYKLARRKHLHAKEKAKREAKPAQVGLPFTMANTVDPNDYARRLGLEA